MVLYEGPYSGGSKQTKETVRAAFNVVKAYLKTVGYEDYRLSVGGYDGMPSVQDPDPADTFTPPEGISYNCIGQTPALFWLYEVESNVLDAERDGNKAIQTLKDTLPEGSDFIVMVIDDKGTYLGDGSSKAPYEPFVFSRNDLSAMDPFLYYTTKYIERAGLTFNGYERKQGTSYAKGYEYRLEFHLDSCDMDKYLQYRSAMEKVQEGMNLTIGDKYNIIITAFRNTKYEVNVQTSPNPEDHWG